MLILGQNHPGFSQIWLNCKISSYISTRWSINVSKAFKTCVRQWAKIEAHWPILILSISPLYQFHSCFSWQQKLAQHSFNIYLHIFRLKITAVTYKLTKDCSLFTFFIIKMDTILFFYENPNLCESVKRQTPKICDIPYQ